MIFVSQFLSNRDKLEQVAEEAGELAKAALKMTRACGLSENPTPKTHAEAMEDLHEEVMDVAIALYAAGFPPASKEQIVTHPKVKRWRKRLEEY